MESKREKSRLRMHDGIFCSRKYAIKHVERYKGIEKGKLDPVPTGETRKKQLQRRASKVRNMKSNSILLFVFFCKMPIRHSRRNFLVCVCIWKYVFFFPSLKRSEQTTNTLGGSWLNLDPHPPPNPAAIVKEFPWTWRLRIIKMPIIFGRPWISYKCFLFLLKKRRKSSVLDLVDFSPALLIEWMAVRWCWPDLDLTADKQTNKKKEVQYSIVGM